MRRRLQRRMSRLRILLLPIGRRWLLHKRWVRLVWRCMRLCRWRPLRDALRGVEVVWDATRRVESPLPARRQHRRRDTARPTVHVCSRNFGNRLVHRCTSSALTTHIFAPRSRLTQGAPGLPRYGFIGRDHSSGRECLSRSHTCLLPSRSCLARPLALGRWRHTLRATLPPNCILRQRHRLRTHMSSDMTSSSMSAARSTRNLAASAP